MQASNMDQVVSIHKYETCRSKEPFLPFQSKNLFISKSEVYKSTEIPGACDSSDSDGKTILVGGDDVGYNYSLSVRGDKEYMFISGFQIITFNTEDKILDFKSILGINMNPTAVAIREKNLNLLSEHYKFIENNKIEERTFFKILETKASTLLIIILQKKVEVLLKRWSVIKFTAFTRMKKLKKMTRRKIYGEPREN